MFTRKLRALTVAFASVATVVVGACKDSAAPPTETPPAIPTPASMQPQFAFFEQNVLAEDSSAGVIIGNWFISAAAAVSVAKAATFLTLAVPVATFAAAFSDDPVFDDGAFRWEYTATGPAYAYQVDLSAQPHQDQTSWEMRVTSANHFLPLNNFLWMTGTSSLAVDSGEWHLFDALDPGVHREILSVEWTWVSAFDRSLTLTNVNTNNPGFGDTLDFDVDGVYSTMQFYDASHQTHVLVQWNMVTYEGTIVAPNVNGGLPACWNSNLLNTPCT